MVCGEETSALTLMMTLNTEHDLILCHRDLRLRHQETPLAPPPLSQTPADNGVRPRQQTKYFLSLSTIISSKECVTQSTFTEPWSPTVNKTKLYFPAQSHHNTTQLISRVLDPYQRFSIIFVLFTNIFQIETHRLEKLGRADLQVPRLDCSGAAVATLLPRPGNVVQGGGGT